MRRLAAVLALALLASPAMAKTKSAKEPRAGQFCSKAAVGSTTQDSKWYDSGMQGGQEGQAALDKEVGIPELHTLDRESQAPRTDFDAARLAAIAAECAAAIPDTAFTLGRPVANSASSAQPISRWHVIRRL